MNYIQVMQDSDDPRIPCEVIQIFTDDEMLLLGDFIQAALDRDIYEPGQSAANTMMQLLVQWENKTQ